MALLLYESKEMYSSTELIRKSKMIFDKIVNNEIEKAIILRDGKPGFLLMDFQKYESIMSEYEKLKEDYEKLTKDKIKKKKNKVPDTIEIENDNSTLESKKEKMQKLLNSLPSNKEVKIPLEEFKSQTAEKEEEPQEEIEKATVEQIDTKKENEQPPAIKNEEEEIKEALFKIKDMNFNPEERAKIEAQIKERIKKARNERAKMMQDKGNGEKEELKEELQLQVHLKKENKKKEQELKEFWD